MSHAQNLHVNMFDLVPFTIRTLNNSNCLQENFLKRVEKITSALQLQIAATITEIELFHLSDCCDRWRVVFL